MTGRAAPRLDLGVEGATLLCVVAVLLASCGGSQGRDAARGEATNDVRAEPLEPGAEALTGAVVRPDLLDVLGRSAGDFLRLVEVEAEVRDGAFAGWRITSLPEGTPSWIDVQRGDVVTAINGMPVERPEDAQAIWETLQVASEVRIDLERAGERRSVRIPVEDVAEGGAAAPAPVPDPALQPAPAGPTE
jgi:hypothetical protein